ncbi:MAG: YncE family protein [Ktedonobacteraceae bacterium]
MRYIWSMRPQHPNRQPVRHALLLCLLGFVLCGIVFMASPLATVKADGGAPNLAYIAGGAQGLSVVDIGQQKVTRTVALGGDPAAVYLTLDGRYVYIAQPELNRVTMLAALTGKVACSVTVPGQPSFFAFDGGINTLYVAGSGASGITALNVNSCTITKTVATQGPIFGMGSAEVGPGVNGGADNQLWFTTANDLNVLQEGKILSIAIPGGPQYVTIPGGATVYVTTHQGNVFGVNLQTLQATTPLLSGGDFGPMDFDMVTNEIYVPDKKHNQLDVLTPLGYNNNTIPPEPGHVIALSATPQSVAITGDGNLGFVALANGGVAMLDIPGKTLINTIAVGGDPRFIITGLYPPTNQQTKTANGSLIPAMLLYIMATVALLLLLVIAFLVILARRRQA